MAHLCYHTAPPHPPFNPYTALLLPPLPTPTRGGLSPAYSIGVACNLGDGLRLVRLAVGPESAAAATAAARAAAAAAAARAAAAATGPTPAAAAGPTGSSLGERATNGQQEPSAWQGGGGDSSGGPGVPAAAAEGPPPEQLLEEMGLQYEVVACCTASSLASPSPAPSQGPASGERGAGRVASAASSAAVGGGLVAAVSAASLGAPLDWEEFIFRAVQQQGLPLHSLRDYGAALIVQGAGQQGRAGILALALLSVHTRSGQQCQQQQQHQSHQQPDGSSTCVPAQQFLLVHIAAETGELAPARCRRAIPPGPRA